MDIRLRQSRSRAVRPLSAQTVVKAKVIIIVLCFTWIILDDIQIPGLHFSENLATPSKDKVFKVKPPSFAIDIFIYFVCLGPH